jgi:hypothetical protein
MMATPEQAIAQAMAMVECLVCNIRPLMAPYCLRNATFGVDGQVCR